MQLGIFTNQYKFNTGHFCKILQMFCSKILAITGMMCTTCIVSMQHSLSCISGYGFHKTLATGSLGRSCLGATAVYFIYQ